MVFNVFQAIFFLKIGMPKSAKIEIFNTNVIFAGDFELITNIAFMHKNSIL